MCFLAYPGKNECIFVSNAMTNERQSVSWLYSALYSGCD